MRLQIVSGPAWQATGGSARTLPERPREPPPRIDGLTQSPSASVDVAAVDVAAGLRCVATQDSQQVGRCELLRSTLDELMLNPLALTKQARIVPSYRDDRPVGFKLYGIRHGSIPKLFGWNNGDLITAVNGRPLTGPASLPEVVEMLHTGRLRISFERRGVELELELELVDALSGPPGSLPGSLPDWD